ncbi:hypothetical protein IR009_13195 [Pseudomonas putida]|uniref:hypothetical protein n=1 Tax=Pseudomonas putida TaxID=303 RepID=UPI0018AB5663|nr:hypothetical protein [Pseudomonas putida]MBF8766177.1 hypothetical protein [Pseudomonas putida]
MSDHKQSTPLDQNLPEVAAAPGSDRRKLIIELIIQHYVSGTSKKLKLKDLAVSAGISRQALDRYYDDLKPYINGSRNISELTDDRDQKIEIQTQSAINAVESHYKDLIQKNQAAHEQAMKAAIDRHITTLMNDDLTLLHSHTISNTLERQTLLSDEYKKKISDLELKLALAVENYSGTSSMGAAKNNLVFNIGIEEISAKLGKDPDIDAFEDAKDDRIQEVRERLTTFANVPNVRVVIFAERYLSRFGYYADNYVARENETALIIRLPLFTRTEFINFTKNLPKAFKISVCVPHSFSEVEKKAQREFMFRNIPIDELKAADNADAPNVSWGFDEVVNFRISQGD